MLFGLYRTSDPKALKPPCPEAELREFPGLLGPRYCIEIPDLEALVAFRARCQSLVILGTGPIPMLEIYDAPRE